jgi:ubiquinone biosynthesis protein Coq4
MYSFGALRLEYQNQHSASTLREGLAQYYASNPNLVDPAHTSTDVMSKYFANHDASHVAFGTSTAIADELVQDLWTFFAVSVKYRKYISELMVAKEAGPILSSFATTDSIKRFFRMIRLLPALILRSRRMTEKWPWSGWEDQLDRPLAEIRRAYGIQVF